jgi:hypothetical protein
MKIILVVFVLGLAGLAMVAKVMFPGISEGSTVRETSFLLWTLVVPVVIVGYVWWSHVRR